jgi:hypothetical protein
MLRAPERALLFCVCAVTVACSLRPFGGGSSHCAPAVLSPDGRTARVPRVPSPSATSGTIVGVVVDSLSRVPLYGANVQVFLDSTRSVGTDSLGGFFVESLPPGRVRIGARQFATIPKVANVTVRAGVADTIIFELITQRCH